MTFFELDDAFRELERRADACGALAHNPALEHVDSWASQRPPHREPSRVLTGAYAALAVSVVGAVGISFATAGPKPHEVRAQVAGITAPPSLAIAPTPDSTAPSTAQPSTTLSPPATDVPKTQTDLIARFRSILGNTATFTADPGQSTDHLIVGVLTSASGTRGMYVLELDTLDKADAVCGSITTIKDGQRLTPPTPQPCPRLTTLADGAKLKVDPNFPDGPPDGVMNDAILYRPDGWQISLYTSNVKGKYYGAPVLGKVPALTTKQVTDIVTSPQWLVN